MLLLLLIALTRVSKQSWRKALRSNPLAPHVAGTVLFWLVVGALPAYGLFEFALARQMIVATMAEQAYIGRAQAWRACRIANDARLVAAPENSSYVTRRISLAALDYTDNYPSAQLATSLSAPEAGPWHDQSRHPSTRFWDVFVLLAPIYNETTTFVRYLDTPPAGRWSWAVPPGEPPVLRYAPEATDACNSLVAPIASRPPATEPTFTLVRFSPVPRFWACSRRGSLTVRADCFSAPSKTTSA